MPHLAEVQQRYPDVQILAVNVEDTETEKNIMETWASISKNGPMPFAPMKAKRDSVDCYDLSKLPKSVVVSPDGKVVRMIVGYSPAEVEDALNLLDEGGME